MDLTALFTLVLGITDKLLAKTPDYDQKKKEQYFKVKRRYENELKRDYQDRDDDLLLNLRDELLGWVESFNREIHGA